MQDQTQLTQAQQSIMHLRNAIHQAQSHPTNEVMGQITHAMERAEKSLEQAEQVADNESAIGLARQELAQQKQAFQDLNQNM